MKKVKLFFSIVFALIMILAGGIQIFKFIKTGEALDGPIPIKDAQLLFQTAQELFNKKQFDQAAVHYEKMLALQDPKKERYEAEAILQLKALKRKGAKVSSLPAMEKKICLTQLEGGSQFFEKLKNQTIQATGTGVFPEGKSGAQGRLMATKAARIDAQRKLLENVKGISINSRMTVSSALQEDSTVAQLQGRIYGAKELATRVFSDYVEVDLQLSGKEVAQMLMEQNY